MARTITSADYFEVDTAPAVTNPPMTVNAWFKAPSGGVGPIFVGADKDVSDRVFGIDLSSQKVRIFSRAAGGFANAVTTSTYSTGVWEMATGAWITSTNRRVFLNGGSGASEGTDVTQSQIDRTSIGRFGDSTPSAAGMDFPLAEIAVWNIGLSDAELALLYNAGPLAYSAFFVRPEALVHYWRFLENSITANITDIVGGLNLTQVSSPAIADHVPLLQPAPRAVWSPPAVAAAGGLPERSYPRGVNRGVMRGAV